MRGARRLLVWDSVGEWSREGMVEPVATLQDLGARLRADAAKPGRSTLGYVGPVNAATFEAFCRMAWAWLRAAPGGVLVVEELADVTAPGKAPPAWGEIVRKHRHAAGRVYALTQRPSESDKTIVGNAAVLHIGRMNMARDRLYAAQCLDVPLHHVASLGDLEFLEKNMRTRALSRGRVTFKRE